MPDHVENRLRREPHCFDFFQAVRLLEQLYPALEPVGRFVPPHTEVVRFAVHPSLAFPASEIQSLTTREQGPPLMTVNFMGLIGPLGVLPLYYTELVQQRAMARDTSPRDFLDLFHHRVLSLFYRAWQKHRFQTYYGRGELDRFTHHLLDLIGLGHRQLQRRQTVPDNALVFYAGLLTQQPRSVVSCEQFLGDYFGVPVRIEQFVGGWYRLEEESQTCFGDEERSSESLGAGAVVGDEVWDPQALLRVIIGPLPLAQYLEFLPSGSAYQPLRTMTRFFAGEEFDFELQLILNRDEVPSCELGVSGEAAPQLGWVSWARSNPMDRDPAETVLPL